MKESEPKPYGAPGQVPLRHPFRPPPGGKGDLREKGWLPFPRMAFWWFLLVLGDLVFYVLLTPIWLGLRAAAWIAELRLAQAESEVRRDLALRAFHGTNRVSSGVSPQARRDTPELLPAGRSPHAVRYRRNGAPRRRRLRTRAETRRRRARRYTGAAGPRCRSAGRRFRAGSRGDRASPRAGGRTSPSRPPRTSRSSPRSCHRAGFLASRLRGAATSNPCTRQTASMLAVFPPAT